MNVKHWIWLAVLAGWLVLGAVRGGVSGISILLHWPIVAILICGYAYDLKGSLAAGCLAAVAMAGCAIAGIITDWTLVGWQFLIYGFFALYPYKFMQIRTQRRHHYTILMEYKRGEIDSLKRRIDGIESKCREFEDGLRRGPQI